MTPEQQRALAIARARRRRAGAQGEQTTAPAAPAADGGYVQPEPPPGVNINTESRSISTPEQDEAWRQEAIQREGAKQAANMGGTRALLPVMQGVSLSGGDEAVSSIAALLQGGNFADNYAVNQSAQAQALAAEREANPIRSIAGELGGGLVLGGGLLGGGRTMAGQAAARGGGLGAVTAGSAIDGLALGGIQGFNAGSGMEDRMAGAESGAKWGLGMGVAVPLATAGVGALARKAISPFATSPERANQAQVLAREGVDLTAGQRTGSRGLRYAEGEIGGGAAEDLMSRQGEQFTAAALRRAGVNANRATPDVIDDAFTRIGGRFDSLAANNTLVPDQGMITGLRDTYTQYNQMVPESARAPIVENITADIVDAARRGPISGETYQSIRSRLARAARTSRADPELSGALRGINEALDDAMERSIAQTNPADAGAWREVRNQYRNMLVIEKAATGAGEASAMGLISPSQLRNATVQQGRRAYARGQGDFSELARAGEALMKPMPQSGTAPRLRAQNLGTGITSLLGAGAGASAGGPMGAAAGAALGAAVPRVAGAMMMSRPGQAYLGNQVAAQGMSPQTQAIVNALILNGGLGATARLGAP